MRSNILQHILQIAREAHGSQRRKYTNELYLVHPQRVMRTLQTFTERLSVLSAALLHDVLEDTRVTAPDLQAELDQLMPLNQARHTLMLVEELTDEYTNHNYPDLNRSSRKALEAKRLSEVSAEAQTVKYADIIDNNREIMQHDPGFGRVYSRECLHLLEVMTRGEGRLRQRAFTILEQNLSHSGMEVK